MKNALLYAKFGKSLLPSAILLLLLWFYFGLAASLWYTAGFVLGQLYAMYINWGLIRTLIQQNSFLRVMPWNNLRCRCGVQITDEDGKLL